MGNPLILTDKCARTRAALWAGAGAKRVRPEKVVDGNQLKINSDRTGVGGFDKNQAHLFHQTLNEGGIRLLRPERVTTQKQIPQAANNNGT